MFKLKDIAGKADACYGCGACVNACKAGAIALRPDNAGFLRPVCDESFCTGCGACRNVCPRLGPDYSNESPEKCLAVMADDGIRKKSSTGGVFTLLARYVLDKGGIVFGAELSDDFLVRHVGVESERDLARLRGSKYAQSDPGMTYREAQAALDGGRHVLYCGCPCQIAGLKKFLGRDYDNLVTVDLLCGGNPSAYRLREYLDDRWGLDNVCGMRFRNLDGWDFRFEVFLRSGETVLEKQGDYMAMYLRHALNKPSCGTCQFDRLPRQGDFTVGDFWNVGKLDAGMDDRLGTSVVLLNNAKARAIWDGIDGSGLKAVKPFTVDEAYKSGVVYIRHGPAPYPKQDAFDAARREAGFTEAVKRMANHYDVGIAGTWLSNFGTISTNWALYNLIRSFGLTACILDVTGDRRLDGTGPLPVPFIRYKGIPRASEFCEAGDYGALNGFCDMFVVGSDQVWRGADVYKQFEEYLHLGFAAEGKRLVAAGTALGESAVGYDGERTARRKGWLSRFGYIGVREDWAVDVLGKTYGVDAEHVQDPVFLCDRSVLEAETRNATFTPSGRYVFAYVQYRKPDAPEFEAARKLAKARGCGLIVNRGYGSPFEEYDADMRPVGTHKSLYRNWMACMVNADLVFTNSFHGVCMPLVFGKDFVAVKGNEPERFGVLARDFGCGDRIFDSLDGIDVDKMASEHMDHDRIGRLVEAERVRGREALRAALTGKKPVGRSAAEAAAGAESRKRAARFVAGLKAETVRLPGAKYLEYLKSIRDPDLESTILIEIPAYRDSELLNTVMAARAMAANPDRIRFAVCLQDDDEGVRKQLGAVPGCKVRHFAEADAPGTCAARYWCQSLYDGEDFVYHVDAHMRFAKYWDVGMIGMWRRCGNPKAILTDITEALRPEWLDLPLTSDVFTESAGTTGYVMNAMLFAFGTCELRQICSARFGGDMPRLGAFRNAGNTFGPGAIDRLVRYDPNMDFRGDETAMTPRLWTSGFDMYHAPIKFVYHLWDRPGRAGRDKGVTAKRDQVGEDGLNRIQREHRRLEKLLGYRDWPDVDLGGYTLGTARSLDEYQAFAGVDFRELTIRKFAAQGFFDAARGNTDLEQFDWRAKYGEKYRRLIDANSTAVKDMRAVPDKSDGCGRNGQRNVPAGLDRVPVEKLAVRFRARLSAEMRRIRGSEYLGYLDGIKEPDLSSTILVEIPSYKDPELVPTIESARMMAANPDRIRFAVCLQDTEANRHILDGIHGLKYVFIPAEQASGSCRARRECQELYDGEDYVFITDSHMRFAWGWDVMEIAQWKACEDPKAILSEYADPYRPEWVAGPDDFTKMAKGQSRYVGASYFWDDSCTLCFFSSRSFRTSKPVKGAFTGCMHVFGPGEFNSVRFDPSMCFMGDEFATDVRWWTHGYNIYHPTMKYVFHLSIKIRWSGQASHRKWHDVPGADGTSPRSREVARMEQLFGLADHGIDLGPYGLGTARSLEEYEEFSGVSFRNRTYRVFSRLGPFGTEHSREDMKLFDWQKYGFERHLPVSARKTVGTVLPGSLMDRLGKECEAKGILVTDAVDRAVEEYIRGLAAGADPVAKFRMDAQSRTDRLQGSRYLEWLEATVRPDLSSGISLEIPAYEDPELRKTIRSALAMAAAPDRIHFAVCLQGGTDEDVVFLESLEHCRYVRYRAEDAPGSCAARADCQELLGDEKYVLRLDGHMRFAWGWDVALIRQWEECGNPKAILTEHPLDYTGLFDEPVDSDAFTEKTEFKACVLNAGYFSDASWVLRTRCLCVVKDAKSPVRGMLVAGGMCFGPAGMNRDVPFDRDMYFVADECSMALRYYTHGYDMYHPYVRCVYHLYDRAKVAERVNHVKIPRFAYQEPGEDGMTRLQREHARLGELFGVVGDDRYGLGPGTKYGPGTVRSLQSFQDAIGVSFRDMSIRKFGHSGRFDVPHGPEDMEFVDWAAERRKEKKEAIPGKPVELVLKKDTVELLKDWQALSGTPLDILVRRALEHGRDWR